jgi:hypothetical protein
VPPQVQPSIVEPAQLLDPCDIVNVPRNGSAGVSTSGARPALTSSANIFCKDATSMVYWEPTRIRRSTILLPTKQPKITKMSVDRYRPDTRQRQSQLAAEMLHHHQRTRHATVYSGQ